MKFLLVIMSLMVMLGGCSQGGGEAQPTSTPLPGTVLDPPRDVADFTLTAHTGEPMKLSDLRGKSVLIFFGYTHCPDVCPLTLAEFKKVKTELGSSAGQVAFVFISVDGERDTPERLTQYVTAFDPDFIGLTGDDSTLRTISRDFGVFFQRQNSNDTNYLVDHTASSFVVDPDGRLHIVYPFDTDPAIIAQGIRKLLEK